MWAFVRACRCSPIWSDMAQSLSSQCVIFVANVFAREITLCIAPCQVTTIRQRPRSGQTTTYTHTLHVWKRPGKKTGGGSAAQQAVSSRCGAAYLSTSMGFFDLPNTHPSGATAPDGQHISALRDEYARVMCGTLRTNHVALTHKLGLLSILKPVGGMR